MRTRVTDKAVYFIFRQIRQLSEEGFSAIQRKIRNVLLIPIVLFVRVLRPLVVIRFVRLRSERIGHFCQNTEVSLCECDAGMYGRRTFSMYYYGDSKYYYGNSISNQQLKKMWDRTLRITRFARYLDEVSCLFPGHEAHVIQSAGRDIHGLLNQIPAHLSFTSEEEYMGYKILRSWGIPDGVPFVCIYSRDTDYTSTAFQSGERDEYNDYRNAAIQNFLPAAEKLTHRGYYVIRLGHIVKEELNTNNPMIIDYATNGYRTDFLDIFLAAKCRFFLGIPGGIVGIPMIIRLPIAHVNAVPLEYMHTWSPNELIIPKKLWLRKERRFMTFREIFESGAGRFLKTHEFEEHGLEVIENTSEEITAVGIEMDERLKGTWQTNDEDEELQKLFWEVFPKSELHGEILSRIGTEFLRQNKELLG